VPETVLDPKPKTVLDPKPETETKTEASLFPFVWSTVGHTLTLTHVMENIFQVSFDAKEYHWDIQFDREVNLVWVQRKDIGERARSVEFKYDGGSLKTITASYDVMVVGQLDFVTKSIQLLNWNQVSAFRNFIVGQWTNLNHAGCGNTLHFPQKITDLITTGVIDIAKAKIAGFVPPPMGVHDPVAKTVSFTSGVYSIVYGYENINAGNIKVCIADKSSRNLKLSGRVITAITNDIVVDGVTTWTRHDLVGGVIVLHTFGIENVAYATIDPTKNMLFTQLVPWNASSPMNNRVHTYMWCDHGAPAILKTFLEMTNPECNTLMNSWFDYLNVLPIQITGTTTIVP
jgi:hypothetical protein